MSQQINSSVQDTAQPAASASTLEPGLLLVPSTSIQLDRIDAMLAAQRAQQAQLALALKSAKTQVTSNTQADASAAWAVPSLSAHAVWFAATGVAVLLLCAGFFVVRKTRFTKVKAGPAAHDSLSNSMLMAAEYSALPPWGPSPAKVAMSQPAFGHMASHVPVDEALPVDLDLDISMSGGAQTDTANARLHATSDFVSDEVRKVQQSLAHKRAMRKSQQRALQPDVLLEAIRPTPDQAGATAIAPSANHVLDPSLPALSSVTIILPADTADGDTQWLVHLQLAQELADLGQTDDALALCQEAFVNGSENVRDSALQMMTQLPQPGQQPRQA